MLVFNCLLVFKLFVCVELCNMCYILSVDYSELIANVGNVTFSDFYGMINDRL